MVIKQKTTNIENRLDTLPKILGNANKALIAGSVLSISTFLISVRLASGPFKLPGFLIDNIRPDVARYLLIFMAVGCSFLIYSWIKQGLDILWTAEFVNRIRVDEIRSHLTGGWLLCSCPLLARLLLVVSFISLLIATKSIIIGLFSILYLITSINVRLGFLSSNHWRPIRRSFLWRFFLKANKSMEKAEFIEVEFVITALVRALRRDGLMSHWEFWKDCNEYVERNVNELAVNLMQYFSEHEIYELADNLKRCFPEYEDAESSSDD